jgi:hypothetical protein
MKDQSENQAEARRMVEAWGLGLGEPIDLLGGSNSVPDYDLGCLRAVWIAIASWSGPDCRVSGCEKRTFGWGSTFWVSIQMEDGDELACDAKSAKAAFRGAFRMVQDSGADVTTLRKLRRAVREHNAERLIQLAARRLREGGA